MIDDQKRSNVLGLLIVLLAIVLLAVGVIGLLSWNNRTVIAVPVGANTAAGGQASVAVESGATPAQAAQSAVVRGGSRNQPTAPVVAQQQPAPTPATGEIMLPGETASPVNANNNAAGGLVSVPSTSAFRLEVLSALYDVSGRPMQGCAAFDNRVPTRRFTLQLAVVNDSGTTLQPGEWGAAAYAGEARAKLCFAGAGGLPAFVNGARQPLTFVVFADPDQVVTSVSITTLSGLSARVCFEEERVIACPTR